MAAFAVRAFLPPKRTPDVRPPAPKRKAGPREPAPAPHCLVTWRTPTPRPGALLGLCAPQRPIHRCPPNLERLGNRRGPHALGLHGAHLGRINRGRAVEAK